MGTLMLRNWFLLSVWLGLIAMPFSDLYIVLDLMLERVEELPVVIACDCSALKLGSWKVMSSLKIWSFRSRYLEIDVSTSCLLAWCCVDCWSLTEFDWLIIFERFSMNEGSLRRQTTISISWSTLYCFRMRSMAERRIPMTFLPFIDTRISPMQHTCGGKGREKLKAN